MRTSLRFTLLVAAAASSGACGAARRTWIAPEAPAGLPAAIEVWRRAPATAEARRAFADAKRLQGLGRVADASARASEAIEADSGFLEAHRLLQDLLLRSTADWWLRERYERRLAERPDDPDSFYYLARLEPDPDRQLELFTEAVARDPQHPYATLGRAISLARRGDVRAALAETRRSSELAPWLALPWIWLGAESMKRGDPAAAARFFAAARDRAADDPRAWFGLADAAGELGQGETASRAALETLRLAPGDEAMAGAAADILLRSSVPEDLGLALETIAAARRDGAAAGPCDVLAGRMLLALGRSGDAEAAFVAAPTHGVAPEELAGALRLARVLAGRYADAVRGALEALPSEAFAADNLYAPRWARLREAADVGAGRARSLLRLAEAMASVGWAGESRAVLVAARAAAPGDEVVARRSASESAFGAFLDDLARLAHESRAASRGSSAQPTVQEVLARISDASRRRLGRDAAAGAVVRSYPFLGEFAVSAASGGEFEKVFGSRGLLCLVGARSGGGAELVLGRIVVVRASSADSVMGEPVSCDECWLESEGLPPEAAGLRRGLAGLTLDRLVLLQLDAIRRAPRPPEPGLPFAPRPAATREERRCLDTPSDVAARIEAMLAAGGRAEGASIDAVRRHELVHVHDAARLLPLSAHPFAALGFVLAHGLDGAATERALEARAQALSIAAVREPRSALAALVAFLPAREGETPHAAAYREAAQAAVDVILDDPAAFPSIDLGRNVLQQMDALTDREVRELGRRLAAKF